MGTNKPCPCRNDRKYRHCHNRMTAQDIAEALDDVEALLGKLERIMSD